MFPLLESEFDQTGAWLSRDGKWLAFGSDEGGSTELYVRPFQVIENRPVLGGGRLQISKNGIDSFSPVVWRADSKDWCTVGETELSCR